MGVFCRPKEHFRPRVCAMVLLAAIAAIPWFPASAAAEFKKTKIAVLDFQVQGGNNENPDMGKIVAEWFITALVQAGRFDVIERRLLEKVLEEQKIGLTGIVDEGSAAKIGRVLGANVVITGTVLQFKEIMEVNARIVEVESSSIVAAENVKSSTGAEKLEDLVFEMSQKIIKDFPLEGYIAQRTDGTVMLDMGQRAGIKRGMRFIAFTQGREIKHPKTGEVLDVETIEAGEIEIVDVRQKTSTAIVLRETTPGAITYGMMVRNTVPESASERNNRLSRSAQELKEQKALKERQRLQEQQELREQQQLKEEQELQEQQRLKEEQESAGQEAPAKKPPRKGRLVAPSF